MKIPTLIAFGFLTVTLTASGSTYGQEAVKVAAGPSVTIDGKIGEAEWKAASGFDLAGGGKVFLTHDGTHLFVGVRGVRAGWSHLYVSQEDSTDVLVLHGRPLSV